jgi:uncharacterized protein YdeI (BOF family)
MKKLILSVVVLLASMTTFAQSETSMNSKKAATSKVTQDGFSEIKATDLPAAVTDALKVAYPDATIAKAFVNEKKEYKLEIMVGDKTATLFADEKGKWLNK